MFSYIGRRILQMIGTLLLISIVSFVVMQLPAGDFVSHYEEYLITEGQTLSDEELVELRMRYGLNRPLHLQYLKWMGGVIKGNLGYSFTYHVPVKNIIGERLLLTFIISFVTLIFTWIVAIPIGIYSATHQYSAGDYTITFLGFIGLAIPNFMLALIFMWFAYSVLGHSVGGLFSLDYLDAPWSLAKIVDLLKHLWIPIVVVGTAGTAGSIRIIRANLLDELQKPYVDTARGKGVSERKLIFKYPLRIALIPFFSTVGWVLPALVSGAIITSVVLNLPTCGPMYLNALRTEDMYLACSFLMFLSSLTVIGTLISDIILALVDPRIRYEGR